MLDRSRAASIECTDYSQQIQFYDLHPALGDFRAELLRGLMQPQKTISPKFLYDKRGAELFDAICQLDEYYLTRTEMAILRDNAAEIAELMGSSALIEFGSGSSQKIRILLDGNSDLRTYVALDISKQHLYEACANLVKDYPDLEAIAICADYTQPFALPHIPALEQTHRVGFFPGSTVGNLEPEEAISFLHTVAALVQPGGGLLIGVDLKKSSTILEPAYDDAEGVSAEFALNLLIRLNRELDANFDLDRFTYRAFYNSALGRIEMYLVSLTQQLVQVGDVSVPFAKGELLRTEYSYKYSIEEFQDLASQAGFVSKAVWVDEQQLFSVHYLSAL